MKYEMKRIGCEEDFLLIKFYLQTRYNFGKISWINRFDVMICVFELCDLQIESVILNHIFDFTNFVTVFFSRIEKIAKKWVIVVCIWNPVNIEIDVIQRKMVSIFQFTWHACRVQLCWPMFVMSFVHFENLIRKPKFFKV